MPVNAYCGSDEIIEKISISPEDVSTEALSEGLPLRVTSRGQSMCPFIKHGDTLLIEVVSAARLKPGDIAFYCLPSGTFVVHRLIMRNGSGSLLTGGDSLRQPDESVTTEQVFGRVAQIERNGKVLKLAGILNRINARLITWLARHRVPLQITLKQTLGGIQWIIGRRRMV
jgi:signal peptidase I